MKANRPRTEEATNVRRHRPDHRRSPSARSRRAARLGDDPPREVAFGAVGRFWSGQTFWNEVAGAQFATFDRPGFARIACNFSPRPYGRGGTLVSYEARTAATDPASRRAFRRYWRAVSPGVGIVMRSQLRVAAREAACG